MHNVLKKYVERILQAQNESSSGFEKSFFGQLILAFDCFGVSFP